MTRISRILKIDTTTTTHAAGWRTPLALVLASTVAATCIVNLTNEASASSPEVAAQDRGQDRRARGVVARELPSADAVEARVKAGVESGMITEEQGIEIMALHKRFAMGVESGRISSEEAAKMFTERYRAMMSGQGEGERKAKAAPKDGEKALANRLGMMMIELGKALEAGEITPEQAIERVMGAARRMQMPEEVSFLSVL